MKAKCTVVACMMAACYLSGILCACAQDEDLDLKMADLESRIDVERDEVSNLRHRQGQAQREKSLLLEEIEQEVSRISKLNPEIKPVAAPVECMPFAAEPQEPEPYDFPSDSMALDAESQAEIDRLAEMKEDLVAEKDSLEKVVKPSHGAL